MAAASETHKCSRMGVGEIEKDDQPKKTRKKNDEIQVRHLDRME
jgi:hypothetical protein